MQKPKKLISTLIMALIFCFALSSHVMAYDSTTAKQQADALKEMSLFLGSDQGYELDREPSRMEALIMLIRMTGKENEALYGDWKHPFTDAPAWENATKYLGYAYEKGLVNGVSATLFAPNSTATAQTYITFMLRALGYTDSASGTVWSQWKTLGTTAGLINKDSNFKSYKRGDVVLTSYAALNCKLYNSKETLAEKLIKDRAFSSLTYSSAKIIAGEKVTADSSLSMIMGAIYLGTNEKLNNKGMAETTINKENLSFYLGVKSLNFTEGLAVEPLMSSRAHSVCLVRLAPGTDVENAKKEIKKNVDPRKWICVAVSPENVRVENIGNLILLVMDDTCADDLVANFLALGK